MLGGIRQGKWVLQQCRRKGGEILQSLLIVTDVSWAPVGSEDESVHGGRTVA